MCIRDSYMAAFEDMVNKCSKDNAPWFVIPADKKWFRDLAISQILVDYMEGDVYKRQVQMNTMNYQAVRFWKSIGVERVILSRELSLDCLLYTSRCV